MSRINTEKIATAGLPDEGIYKFRVETIEEVDRTNREGEDYTRVEARFVLLENGNGALDFNSSVFENFYTDGRGLERFVNLFKSITGYVPEGTVDDDGNFYVDTKDMLDEIRGGEAWGAYTHATEKREDGTKTGRFGWQFNADGTKVRMPRKRS